MFREMRRKKQQLSREETIDILKRGTAGVLALSGDDGYPYAVPISYLYDDCKILFHCAKSGHKIDAIRNCDKASFCVIDKNKVVPEEYTTYYRSVIVFGRIRILEAESEVNAAIRKFAYAFYPDDNETARSQLIEKCMPALCMLEFSIEYMTGKESMELTNIRNAK